MIAFDPQRWVSQETELAERMLKAGPGWWDEARHHAAELKKAEPSLFTELHARVERFIDAQQKAAHAKR